MCLPEGRHQAGSLERIPTRLIGRERLVDGRQVFVGQYLIHLASFRHAFHPSLRLVPLTDWLLEHPLDALAHALDTPLFEPRGQLIAEGRG